MTNRKNDIMNTAEKLFNQRGYQNVSLGDIADTLGISKGNLTYYFQRKEDLIEACILRRHENYQKPGIPGTIAELNAFIYKLLKQQETWPYYFKNYMQLAEACPKVYEIQCSVLEDLKESIGESLNILMIVGKARKDCVNTFYGIAQCILSVLAYGIPTMREQSADQRLFCIWSILFPCLTEKGRREFRSISKEKDNENAE